MTDKQIEELKIDKGVPVVRKHHSGSKWDVKIDAMECGDSFVVEDESDYESFRAALRRKGFTVARERTNQGYRVWKMAKPRPEMTMEYSPESEFRYPTAKRAFKGSK